MNGRFQDLEIKTSYRRGQDDIAGDFLVPCMMRAVRYERAVGYFRSAAYSILWTGMVDFIRAGGKIRIVCSHYIDPADRDAVLAGTEARIKEELAKQYQADLQVLLESPVLGPAARALATLVATGVVDMKIAVMSSDVDPDTRKLFHDKLGILEDADGDIITFRGSMNETHAGISEDGNLESVDVFVSWADKRERQRIKDHSSFFKTLWRGYWPKTRVVDLPQAVRENLVREASKSPIEDVIGEAERATSPVKRERSLNVKPYPHQIETLESWDDAGRVGIVKHATGSGKTITALLGVRECLERGEKVLVLVPSVLLLKQWREEISKFFRGEKVKLLCCGGGNDAWAEPGVLAGLTARKAPASIVLSTLDTAQSPVFRKRIRWGRHLAVFVDEVHRIGAPTYRQILESSDGPIMGLSATPERAGDPVGTRWLFDKFGQVLKPEYGIFDAISDGRLCPYFYHPSLVSLTAEEQADYNELTTKIRRLRAQMGSESDDDLSGGFKNLLIKRASIVKAAAQKIGAAVDIISKEYKQGSRWLVYCENVEHVRELAGALRGVVDARVMEYHYSMEGDAETTLRFFSSDSGIVIAVKCLDEGVDIPAADTALILASSQNPREHIQRRGRVLRKSPDKNAAHIYDVLVVPGETVSGEKPDRYIYGEMARCVEFGEHAINSASVAMVRIRLTELGVNLQGLINEGVEDDGE